MTLFVLGAGAVAVALLRVWRLAVPARTDLVGAVQRWDQARVRATRVQRIGDVQPSSLGSRLRIWLAEQVMLRSKDAGSLSRDLAVTGSDLDSYLSKMLAAAGLGLVVPLVLWISLSAMGLVLPLALMLVLAIVLVAGVGLTLRQELRGQAARRRTEFRRSLSTYLDLVAMSLQAGRGHAEALPAAAAIGDGWAFTYLQDAVHGARFAGITAADALGQLGDRLGVRELGDLESALRLAADDGAKVRATLIARAETLRAERIADAEASAARATESMKFALIVMVFVFLTYELYPSVARLFAG